MVAISPNHMQNVTLGDARAGGGTKTRLERGGPPAFAFLVEVVKPGEYHVRGDLAATVDKELKSSLSDRIDVD
jgi:hypothetical protein